MFKHPLKILGLFLFLLFFSITALAVLDLNVKESLEVYKEADKKSRLIIVAEPGDRFVVSPVDYGSYYKILLVGLKEEEGYILKEKVKRSTIKERFIAQNNERYHWSYGVGLFGIYSDTTVKTIKFVTAGGVNYTAEKMHGTSSSSGISLDFPINLDWGAKLAYASRKIKMAAEAGPTDGISGNKVELQSEQVYKSYAGEVKYYFSREVEIWGGFGVENFSLESSSFYIYNLGGGLVTIPVEIPQGGNTLFASLGIDIGLGHSKKLFLLPEVRYQQALNSSFEMKIYEIFLGLAWKF